MMSSAWDAQEVQPDEAQRVTSAQATFIQTDASRAALQKLDLRKKRVVFNWKHRKMIFGKKIAKARNHHIGSKETTDKREYQKFKSADCID